MAETDFNWSKTGQSYIYHIEVGNLIYVGQSKSKNIGSRLEYRLRGPFVGYSKYATVNNVILGKDYDEPELAAAIRKNGLRNTKVTYFQEDNLYGLNDNLLKAFKQSYKVSKGNAEISNLNAAEILHILWCYKYSKKKIVNKSMGGTDGAINIVEGDKIIKKALTKFMTPAQAHQIFSSNADMTGKLMRLRDSLNDLIFTDN